MQKYAIEARFGGLADAFTYDDGGSIYDLNHKYMWNNKISSLDVAHYILDLIRTSEYSNMSLLTDVTQLKASIRRAAWI